MDDDDDPPDSPLDRLIDAGCVLLAGAGVVAALAACAAKWLG